MVKIYKTTDKIPVKIDSLTFKISPLSFDQKSEIQAELITGNPMSIIKAAKLAIKYAVKDVDGIVDNAGDKYLLEFDNDCLSESCVDDILNIDQNDKLSFVCTSLLNGIPKEFIDPQTGEKLEGVSIKREPSRKKK